MGQWGRATGTALPRLAVSQIKLSAQCQRPRYRSWALRPCGNPSAWIKTMIGRQLPRPRW